MRVLFLVALATSNLTPNETVLFPGKIELESYICSTVHGGCNDRY